MKNLILLLSFFLFNNVFSQEQRVYRIDSLSDELIALDTLWLYHPGDDTAWAAFDFPDQSWDTLSTELLLTGREESFFPGNAWFRLHIEIDSSLMDEFATLTLRQVGASEIYHNGKRIRSFGTVGTADREESRSNPMNIPFLLRFNGEKHHVIAVRYSNQEAEKFYKRYNTPLAGYNMFISTFRGSIDRMISLYVISLFFISLIIIFVVLGALHFLLYVFFRQNRSNLYYSIFVMAFAVLILWSLAVNSFIFGTGFVIKTRYLISLLYPFILVPLVRLLYSMFREKLPRMFWVVLALAFISTLCYVFNVSFITFIYAGFSVIVFFEIVRVTVQAIWRRIGGSWIIGVGVLVFIAFFTVISFIILFRGGLVISGIWYSLSIVMAVLSIPVSMSLFLARDFSRTNRNLKIQLEQVKLLSAKTLEQEKEKQRILEGQKERLEVMVKERTRELEEEKDKTEKLLLNTLPLKVVNDLKENGYTEPESFDEVTVYFSDLVGFTDASSRLEPAVLIEELNRIFTAFDDIMTTHHCERIKTIGDAYLAVCGMPEKNEDHAENMAQAALEIRHYLEERNGHSEIKWKIRIGIHSGKVVGGIVGVRKYIYDVFGDTINTASRMESNSEPMRINVSETTYEIIKEKFRFSAREPMEIKGKGKMRMYFLEGG